MNTVTEDKIDTKGSISIKESKRKEKVLRHAGIEQAVPRRTYLEERTFSRYKIRK